MKKILFSILVTIMLLCNVACAAPAPQVADKSVLVEVEREVVMDGRVGESAKYLAEPDVANLAQRMIIHTAELSLMVKDPAQTLGDVKSLVAAVNGYVANSNSWYEDEQMYVNLTLRVPADEFDATVEQLKKLALKVTREEISGQDVTEEYTDLESRLRNLEAAEAQLMEIMAEARKTEDVLAVHRELTDIRGQIEQTKGRMQYLEQMTALATINVYLSPESRLTLPGWAPSRTLRAAFSTLIKLIQFLVDLVIWGAVVMLPLLFLLLLPFLILWRGWRWWRSRKK